MVHVVVIGREGQLARSLRAAAVMPSAPAGLRLTAIGRDSADIADAATVKRRLAAERPDLVINAAAYTAVDRAESEPDAAYAVNAAGPAILADLTAALSVPLIHVSTDYVFDGRQSRPYLESDPVGPMGVYGRTKLAGEVAVATRNPRHVIVRTAWVFSPYGHNFVRTMLRLAGERPELRVVDDQVGCPTYAPDLADGLLHIANAMAGADVSDARFGIYHATNAGTATWADFASAIMTGAQRRDLAHVPVHRIATADYPTPARRPAHSRLDTGKLAATFGLTLPPWQDALERCLDVLAGAAAPP